jgi:peptidoglycan/xylan/chitin deacetylase (PgdA/CDA1 family)
MIKTLNFHRVSDSNWFESVIHLLKREFSFVSASDSGGDSANNGQRSCHLTFDDGEISFYNVILPVLKRHKIPATLFVSPKICKEKINYWFQEIEAFDSQDLKKIIAAVAGVSQKAILKNRTESILKSLRIDQINEIISVSRKRLPYSSMPFRNISVSQLKEIDRSELVTLGAHTLNHPILKNENNCNSKFEITKSVSELSELLDHPVHFFAYPNGISQLDFTGREKTFLSACGIRRAWKNEACSSLYDDHLSLPRIAISDYENLNVIKIKMNLGGTWDSLKKFNPGGEYIERRKLLMMK